MNYIEEVNSFYEWIRFKPIPAGAQALWHLLMNINNGCAVNIDGKYYWPVEFTVSNGSLTSVLDFSRTQLDRMRNVLIQSGRIVYKKGNRGQSGKYRINPFNTHYVTQPVTHPVTQLVTQVWQLCNIMCTLNNNNTMNDDGDIYKRTPETEDIQEKIQELVKKYFGRNSTDKDLEIVRSLVYRKQSIDQKTTVGPDDTKVELLEHAMDIAYMSGTMTWNYVLGILRNFTKRGITTVDDAEAYQAEIDMAAGKI